MAVLVHLNLCPVPVAKPLRVLRIGVPGGCAMLPPTTTEEIRGKVYLYFKAVTVKKYNKLIHRICECNIKELHISMYYLLAYNSKYTKTINNNCEFSLSYT